MLKSTIRAFQEINCFTYRQEKTKNIISEITKKGKEYILRVDENDFVEYLIDRYTLTQLVVNFENVLVNEPTVSKEWIDDHWGEKYQTDVYTFTITYPFSGSAEIFKVRPDSYVYASHDISIDEGNSSVSFSFKLTRKDPIEFNRTKQSLQNKAFGNLDNANQLILTWNNSLKNLITSIFEEHKKNFQQENDFFAAINVKVNDETASVFSTPTVKKRIIPQPIINNKKEFSSEPMMSTEMYNDVLKVIYDSGKSMEKKPALYQAKDEEGLRDQFLFVLETRYEGTTASGETFNRSGKTDILLKYANDGSNLFVAECKFWHGTNEFLKAISQLFDRYLTWRDSKTALIMFVNNKDFSAVISTVKDEVYKHPYFNKFIKDRGESSFSYLFHLPQDHEKLVHLEIILFHYDK